MQKVNFYQPQFHIHRELFSARNILLGLGGVVVLLTMMTVGITIWMGKKRAEIKIIEKTQLQLATEVGDLGAKYPERKESLKLKEEIKRLQDEKIGNEALLKYMENEKNISANGFSAILDGFVQAKLSGIWLTAFGVLQEGRGLIVHGRTKVTTPDLLPKYIDRLYGEEVFHGYSFSDLSMNKDLKQAQYLGFAIKTDSDLELMYADQLDGLSASKKALEEIKRSREQGAKISDNLNKNMKNSNKKK
ncbi:MAG: hypothetical protein H7832_13755 [Magnetococcus sp. DMHC-6]